MWQNTVGDRWGKCTPPKPKNLDLHTNNLPITLTTGLYVLGLRT